MSKKVKGPVRYKEGMKCVPGKKYLMTGAQLVDFGQRIDSDGFLIGNTFEYEVLLGLKWVMHKISSPK